MILVRPFLAAIVASGDLSYETAARMHRMLELLKTEPQLGLGPDGMVGATWELGGGYINIEIFADGTVEWESDLA